MNTLTSLAEDNAASSEETSAMAEELSQTVSRSIDTVADLKKEIEELMQDVKKVFCVRQKAMRLNLFCGATLPDPYQWGEDRHTSYEKNR